MRRPQLSPPAYRRITLIALVALGVIVVTGAAVRLTGSGLGCSTWPNCEPDSLIPLEESGDNGWIEFLNRLFTGVVSVAVVLAVLGSRYRVPRRRDLTWWSWSLVVGVAAQAILGGITVLTHLSPPIVMSHFLLSAVLVACATVLHHRAGEPDEGHRRPVATPEVRLMVRGLVVMVSIVLFSGTVVTGTGPHGGDADVERLPFFLPEVTRIHALAVWLLLAGTLWTLWLVRRGGASPVVQRGLQIVVVAEVAQGAVGYLQYFLEIPVELVALHIFGSMAVLVAAVSTLLHTSVVEPVRREKAAKRAAAPAAVPS